MPVSAAKRHIAKEKTSAQEMKLGRVVKICTNFLNRVRVISLRNTAKIMGSQLVARFRPLMPSVFFSTRSEKNEAGLSKDVDVFIERMKS
jgi:hypothetical protein